MMNLFKVALLFIALCMMSFAKAQAVREVQPPSPSPSPSSAPAPGQSPLSLQQFQQWMQQQKTTGGAPPAGSSTAPPPVATQSGLPPPGSPGVVTQVVTPVEARVPATTNVITVPPGEARTIGVPIGPKTIRPETIQFRSEAERRTATVRRRVNRDRPITYDESRRIMIRSVPNSLVPPIPESNYAFNTLLQQNTPLTPQQVVKLHQQIDISQRAAATPPLIPPKPVSTTLMINLAPGTTPPAVRLAVGYVTSLVFVDSTGAPWPIAAFDIGNPKAVNIQWDGKGNIILMQALQPYSYGDMVLRLVGLPTPVTIELVSGQRVVDYRVDIHVPGLGPNTTELPIGSNLPPPANSLLLDVLEGVAPPGSRALSVRGADCQAWLLADRLFLRCRLTLLSPGWIGKMVSPDGMNAYELPKASSILVSRYGEPTELKIDGY